jgi:hypothetical protein
MPKRRRANRACDRQRTFKWPLTSLHTSHQQIKREMRMDGVIYPGIILRDHTCIYGRRGGVAYTKIKRV